MADRTVLDFDPAVRQLKAVLGGVTDEQLSGVTPCPDWTVGALLDHLGGLAVAFTDAARKASDPADTSPPPAPSADALDPRWRDTVPARLEALSEAWRDPAAWDGMTQAGGVTLPAAVMGVFALNELVVHGWDLARATGQPFEADPRGLEAVTALLAQAAGEGAPRIFGPVVRVGEDASALDRVVGLSGRDPAWKP